MAGNNTAAAEEMKAEFVKVLEIELHLFIHIFICIYLYLSYCHSNYSCRTTLSNRLPHIQVALSKGSLKMYMVKMFHIL